MIFILYAYVLGLNRCEWQILRINFPGASFRNVFRCVLLVLLIVCIELTGAAALLSLLWVKVSFSGEFNLCVEFGFRIDTNIYPNTIKIIFVAFFVRSLLFSPSRSFPLLYLLQVTFSLCIFTFYLLVCACAVEVWYVCVVGVFHRYIRIHNW